MLLCPSVHSSHHTSHIRMLASRSSVMRPKLAGPQTLPSRPVLLVRSSPLQEKLPVDAGAVLGPQLGPWLSTTYDLLAFPARAGAGALVSMPERLGMLQSDVQRLVELAQDPRPLEEKSDVLRKEIESTMVEFLERGTIVEQDVLANLKTVLPPEAATVLTDMIPEPPNKHPQTGPVVPVPSSDITQAQPEQPPVTYGQQDVLSVQIASEITEIRNAVSGLNAALDSLRSNTDAAQSPVLRLTLRDARDQLQRRLTEVAPVTATDPSVAAATREASILLEEVNAVFFASPSA